jgi:3-dehydroquinate synthase
LQRNSFDDRRPAAPAAGARMRATSDPHAQTSETYRQSFSARFDYDVIFTRHCLDFNNPALARAMGGGAAQPRPRCVVFVDLGLVERRAGLTAAIETYFQRADAPLLAAPPLVLPGGEAIKNEAHYIGRMHDLILDNAIDRHSYVLAIGGGALLDAVGLAASTAHRGVRLVRAPTTVLAQNDGGVGVKSAINRNGAKNQIGTFAPPWAVIVDSAFLDTLPARDRVAGMAEAVKVALIRDAEFFLWLERSADALSVFATAAMETLIRRCALLHMRQIAQGGDPFEQGSARPLDFGHWAAHRLEALTRHHLRHGEAVAVGLALDTRYSVLAGLAPEGLDARVAVLLERLGFRLFHAALERRDAAGRRLVLAGLDEFREHLGGRLTITLLRDIGAAVETHEMDVALVEAAIDWLAARERP